MTDTGVFEAVFERAPAAMATVTEQGRLTRVNATLARALSLPQGDVVGRPLDDIVVPADAGVVLELLAATRAGDGCPTADVHLARPDGTPAYGARLEIVAKGEVPGAWALAVLDVRWSGSIAHDLNNQLSVVRSHAEVALYRNPDPRVREHLEAIRAAGERSIELVQRLWETSAPPKRATAPSAPPRLQTPAPRRAGRRVLVVDDEPFLRELAERILTEGGFDVAIATDGASALARMRALGGEVDLLLTDLAMPRMTGRQLATAIRALRPDLPVLFMTGTSPDAGPEERAVAWISKPFDAESLRGAVRRLLERAPARDLTAK